MVDLASRADPGSAPSVKALTTATFSADVLLESRQQPVIVLFTSARSSACRTLQAQIERAVGAAAGRVKFATMDIDTQPQIAGRLGIRGVPAVYAFQGGQPIDGFVGALPEAQVRGFIERLVGPIEDDSAAALAEAEAALAADDPGAAGAIFAAILEGEPDNAAAIAGLARAMVATGDFDGARDMLGQVPPSAMDSSAVLAAQAALSVAEQARSVGDLSELQNAATANPDDHQAQLDYAIGLNAQGRREQAVDVLIASLHRDRSWNDGAARRQLLQFFEAWGLMDPVTLAARRKLSALLFA